MLGVGRDRLARGSCRVHCFCASEPKHPAEYAFGYSALRGLRGLKLPYAVNPGYALYDQEDLDAVAGALGEDARSSRGGFEMALYWGVDSYNAANHMVRVPSTHHRAGEGQVVHETLYDYVTRRAGREPRFWGRYLNRNLGSRLQAGEAAFIFSRSQGNCRIALVYNGVRAQPSGTAASRSGGLQAANEAISIAVQLGIPAGVRIYLDLEGWSVPDDYVVGWWEGMYASPYAGAGGLYGRGSEVRPRTGTHLPAHGQRPHSTGWAGTIPRAESAAHARTWQSLLQNLASGLTEKTSTKYIWTNTPRRADLRGDTPSGTEIIPPAFGGIGPVGSLLTETVIWQYRFGAFWADGGQRGTVDLDLANETGYREMWRARI